MAWPLLGPVPFQNQSLTVNRPFFFDGDLIPDPYGDPYVREIFHGRVWNFSHRANTTRLNLHAPIVHSVGWLV